MPGQVNLLRLTPFYTLMKSHGLLFTLDRNPLHIDASKIPADFVHGFQQRSCSRLSCGDCRYCEEIAEDTVTIDAAFQKEQLARLKDARQQVIDGRLWSV